jgi:hypothetical protein
MNKKYAGNDDIVLNYFTILPQINNSIKSSDRTSSLLIKLCSQTRRIKLMMDQQASSSSLSRDLAIRFLPSLCTHRSNEQVLSGTNTINSGVNAIHRYYPPTPLHDMSVRENLLACVIGSETRKSNEITSGYHQPETATPEDQQHMSNVKRKQVLYTLEISSLALSLTS